MGRSKKGAASVEEWQVVVHPLAKKQILAITDLRVREDIEQSIDDLRYEPDKKGKLLRKMLKNTRSIRAGSQRYRVIYKLKENIVTVTVISVGIRMDGNKKDVYAQTEKQVRSGVFDDI